jgi:hypothetical protein
MGEGVFCSLQAPSYSAELEPSGPGNPGRLEWVALERLVIDTRYQREIGKRGANTIRAIVEAFSWAEFDPVVVAPADGFEGKLAVIDGQHRATAAMLHPEIDAVPCWIHEIDLAGQARAFRGVNGRVTAMSHLHFHRAGVAAGDPDALYVERACARAGVVIARYPKAQRYMAPEETIIVTVLSKALKVHGERPVVTALQAIRKAWPGLPGAVNRMAFEVVLAVVLDQPARSVEALAAVLQDLDFESLADEARPMSRAGGGTVKSLVARRVMRLAREAGHA